MAFNALDVNHIEQDHPTGQAAEGQPGEAAPQQAPEAEAGPPDAATVEVRVETPIELAARTLTGDLRDFIVEQFRAMRDPWHKLSESRQSVLAAEAQDFADSIVTSVVNLLAARDFPAVAAVLGEVKFNEKGCDLKLGLSRLTRDARHAIVDARGGQIMLVIADPGEFNGARGPAKVDRQALFDAPPREPDEPEGEAIGPILVDASEVVRVPPDAAGEGADDGIESARKHNQENNPDEADAPGAAEIIRKGECRDAPEVNDASEAARQYFRGLGRDAALRGQPRKNNPFPRGMRAHGSWAIGWEAGRKADTLLTASDAAAAAPNGAAVAP